MVPLVTRHGRLDLLNIEHTAGAPATYEDLRGRALVECEHRRERRRAWPGLDDLIRMKRAAGREQDLLDIAALARADEELERDARESTWRPHGSRRPLPGHRGLLAQPAARPPRHADPARRRPAARGLRRGHPAPADALGRAWSSSRRSSSPTSTPTTCSGCPGMLKTFAPAPARARAHGLRAARPAAAVRRCSTPVIGRLTFPVELVELEPNDELDRDGYRIAAFEVDHGGRGLGYALVEEPRPGVFDPVAGARARRHPGPRLRPPAARRDGQRSRRRTGDGGGASRAQAGAHRRHRSLRHDPARGLGGRPPRARGHLHGRGRRARARDPPLDGRPGGRRWRPAPRRTARAHAHLAPLLGRPGARRGARERFAERGGPARLRPHRDSLPRAR